MDGIPYLPTLVRTFVPFPPFTLLPFTDVQGSGFFPLAWFALPPILRACSMFWFRFPRRPRDVPKTGVAPPPGLGSRVCRVAVGCIRPFPSPVRHHDLPLPTTLARTRGGGVAHGEVRRVLVGARRVW